MNNDLNNNQPEIQKVNFNKLEDDQIYSFSIHFYKLYQPNLETEDANEVNIDFASNEDIDFLIEWLNKLKETK